MKKYIVIEADTNYYSLFAYEVSRKMDDKGDDYVYRRKAGCEALVQALDRPRFFGTLDVLLPTAETLRSAAPIELVKPAETPTWQSSPPADGKLISGLGEMVEKHETFGAKLTEFQDQQGRCEEER